MSSYFYTETAFHHQGDIEFLKKLIDASAEAGVNGVKFQVLTAINDFVSSKHKAYNDLASYCFSFEQWTEIFEYTKSAGLDLILMPLNSEALRLPERFTIKYIDIHSVSFNDTYLLDLIKKSKVDVILGVGGRTLNEIEQMQVFFADQLKVLMVGFQSFPSKLEDVKLAKIADLKERFPNIKIGYADHSAFDHDHAISSNEYARFLGATVFEKHISIEEGTQRVDSASAISKEKVKLISEKLKFIDSSILLQPEENWAMTPAEVTYRERQLRCVAATNLPKGKALDKSDVRLKLVDNQEFTFSRIEDLVGKVVSQAIHTDDVITLNLLQ